MKIILILFILHLYTSIDFDDTINKLEILEKYIREYIIEKKKLINGLILN